MLENLKKKLQQPVNRLDLQTARIITLSCHNVFLTSCGVIPWYFNAKVVSANQSNDTDEACTSIDANGDTSWNEN